LFAPGERVADAGRAGRLRQPSLVEVIAAGRGCRGSGHTCRRRSVLTECRQVVEPSELALQVALLRGVEIEHITKALLRDIELVEVCLVGQARRICSGAFERRSADTEAACCGCRLRGLQPLREGELITRLLLKLRLRHLRRQILIVCQIDVVRPAAGRPEIGQSQRVVGRCLTRLVVVEQIAARGLELLLLQVGGVLRALRRLAAASQ
jgi:hypothetical protein